MSNTDRSEKPVPWWRFRMVWFVISGPLIVVIASFVTLGLAIKYPDPVLHNSSDVEQSSNKVSDGASARSSSSNANLPAMEARNHAATGGR